MSDRNPRLLLVVRPQEELDRAVARRLPEVPFAYLDGSGSGDGGRVEAVLLGSVVRDAVGWDPRALPRLRFVQRIYAGVDDVPFGRFAPDVAIAGNVGGYAPFVAEHAVALALGAVRALVPSHAMVSAGRLRPLPELDTLWHRTAVILGFGAIGREIALRVRALGMQVVGVNRRGTPSEGADQMVDAAHLVDALARADVVFDARPLTTLTRASIGMRELTAMPTRAVFVNVGRGGTVDEAALYRHLVDHPEFRAALDVWWEEDFAGGRLSARYPFPSLPNVLGTPHSAANAPPVAAYALGCALDNLARFFSGEPPLHVVDRSEYVGLAPD